VTTVHRVRVLVPTSVGEGRITWHRPEGASRGVLVIGHGSATGVESPDLRALAAALPPRGFTVALVEQPWRVEGGFRSPGPATLDAAWRDLWPTLAESGQPMVAGGRSAGSQVACRTGRELGARAVLALAYPLRGPGSAGELLATGLPTLIVQGDRDPFGTPAEFPARPASMELVEIPGAEHIVTAPGALATLTGAVGDWLDRRLPA
jgi:uncharacterized protein